MPVTFLCFFFIITNIVSSFANNAFCSFKSGKDCYGNDLSNKPASTRELCCSFCSETSGCVGFSWCDIGQGPTCYMKSSCSKVTPKSQCTAGVVSNQPTPAPPPTPVPPPTPIPDLSGVQSTQDLNNLLAKMTNLPSFVQGSPPSGSTVIKIDASQTYQTILGFGGAFTEAASINFYKLSGQDQEKVLQLYFGTPETDGHGYTIGRVPMNSCDFSPGSYSFDDVAGDTSLAHFDMNVSHDQRQMIPFIKRATAKALAHDGLKVFTSPWSPPAWMKTNGQMTGSGQPGLKDEDQAAWALYFSKFFTAYKNSGINLWGLTVQNEPGYAAPWEACCYSAAQERDFLKNHLGPVMRRDHPNASIMIYDHNKDDVVEWAKTIFGDAEASKYADGMAVHWYSGGQFENLEATHSFAPNKFILGTEACNCGGVHLRDWGRGLHLAQDILGDLNAWAVGWTDWNLILDTTGGPNHLGNLCDADIIADPQQKLGSGTVIQQVSYYQKGHFSRYVRPGAVRVGSSIQGGDNLQVTAFRHPTKKTTTLVIISTAGNPQKIALYDIKANANAAGITIPGNSMVTLVYSHESFSLM